MATVLKIEIKKVAEGTKSAFLQGLCPKLALEIRAYPEGFPTTFIMPDDPSSTTKSVINPSAKIFYILLCFPSPLPLAGFSTYPLPQGRGNTFVLIHSG
jgi:hypothetical protein